MNTIKIPVEGEAQPRGLRTMVIKELEVYASPLMGGYVFTGIGKRGGTAPCLRIREEDIDTLAQKWLNDNGELVCLRLSPFEYRTLIDVLEQEIDRNSGAGYDDIDNACRQISTRLRAQYQPNTDVDTCPNCGSEKVFRNSCDEIQCDNCGHDEGNDGA